MNCIIVNNNEGLKNEFDELIKSFNLEEVIHILKQRLKLRDYKTSQMINYRSTENGRQKTREASKRYYYRKNNKYHPVYNPDAGN